MVEQSGREAFKTGGQVFKPGEECPLSGVYRVVHDPVYTKDHEVTCVYGKKFSPCNDCGHYVRFVLEHGADHVDVDDNFKTQVR
jgi:hypothetical protein